MQKKPTLKKDTKPKPQDTMTSIDSAAAVLGQKNPYGASPGGGITLPPYYKPTPGLIT
jgi:ribonuclease Z